MEMEENMTGYEAPADDIEEATDAAADQEDLTSMKSMYDAQPVNNIFADAEVTVNPAVVEALSQGFVERFLPSLENARTSIDQIKSSQSVLIETIQQEVTKFSECTAIADLELTMNKAKVYHNKLLRLRKEMTNLHEKSGKLKRRALRLQQQKQKEELTRAHNQEREFEKERLLTAKVAPSSPTSPSDTSSS